MLPIVIDFHAVKRFFILTVILNDDNFRLQRVWPDPKTLVWSASSTDSSPPAPGRGSHTGNHKTGICSKKVRHDRM